MCDADYDSDDLFVDSPISASQSSSQRSSSEYDLRYQNWDNKRIRQLRDILTGVPPPPSVTTPRQTAEDVVKIWAETSLNLVDSGFSECEPRQECLKVSLDEVLNCDWPEVKNNSYFDIYYNQGNCSEELYKLYEKYKERYVDCETSSFINYKSPKKKKDRPKMTGHSPGRRLSHLAKRRTIFSSASLLAASKLSTLGPEKKTIMMNTKYEKHKGKLPKRILFGDDEFKVTSEKCTFKKYSPNKINKMAFKKGTPKKKTPKKSGSIYCTPKKSCSSMHFTPKKSTPKKLLGISILNENGKRMRNTSTDNSDLEATCDLSSSQKRKLLWAVSGALKKIGISSSHDDFQICGKKLYKRCRTMWTGNNGESTSEKMLSLACENAKHIVNEVQLAKSQNNIRNLIFDEDSSSCDSFFKI